MIKISEFSTIAVLVAATAVVVAVQQHRERRPIPPPAIEAPTLAPATDARLAAPTGVDLLVTSQRTLHAPGGP